MTQRRRFLECPDGARKRACRRSDRMNDQMSPLVPWPLTSFTALQKGGRYRINSGQTAPSGLTGSAAFDPLQKLRALLCF